MRRQRTRDLGFFFRKKTEGHEGSKDARFGSLSVKKSSRSLLPHVAFFALKSQERVWAPSSGKGPKSGVLCFLMAPCHGKRDACPFPEKQAQIWRFLPPHVAPLARRKLFSGKRRPNLAFFAGLLAFGSLSRQRSPNLAFFASPCALALKRNTYCRVLVKSRAWWGPNMF